MEAERAANKYKQVEFMQQYLGEEFEGVISGVAKAPNVVDQQYGYNTGLAGALGVMANPTPSQENIGVMSPLASVLFKA